jgi:hypothetical protein
MTIGSGMSRFQLGSAFRRDIDHRPVSSAAEGHGLMHPAWSW